MAQGTTRPIARKRHKLMGGGKHGSQFGGKLYVSLLGLDKAEQVFTGPAMEELVRGVLEKVLERSQDYVHVITGALKDSGRVVTTNTGKRGDGIVEYTMNYAAPEEFGAQGREPHPYLRPAWDEVVTFGGGKQELANGIIELQQQMNGDE